jgi:hypothetical protein
MAAAQTHDVASNAHANDARLRYVIHGSYSAPPDASFARSSAATANTSAAMPPAEPTSARRDDASPPARAYAAPPTRSDATPAVKYCAARK